MGDLEQEASEAPGGLSAGASAGASAGRRTRLQSAIANIWTDILGIDQVDGDADFFELGGDSLAAVRMLAAVDDLLLTQVSFVDFLDGPTVDALAGAVLDAREAPRGRGPGRPTRGRRAQARNRPAVGLRIPRPPSRRSGCGSSSSSSGATDAYNMPIGARLRRAARRRRPRARPAEIVRRHAALRTTFAAEDGRAVQVVADDGTVVLDRVRPARRA